MRQIGFLTGIALMTLVTGCTKIKQLININVDIPYSTQITVPTVEGDPAGIPLPAGGISIPFPAIGVATNSQQYIAEYQTSTDKVLDVDMKSLVLQILMPPSQNFDFLDTMQVFISTRSLPEMLVATAYNIPKGETTLNLTPDTTVNLKPYFIQDTIFIRMGAHVNAIPASGTELNAAFVFHMLANPLD